MILVREMHAMSNRAAKLAFVEPQNGTGHIQTQEHYPRHLVMWGALTFCLSSWAVVILAVARLA